VAPSGGVCGDAIMALTKTHNSPLTELAVTQPRKRTIAIRQAAPLAENGATDNGTDIYSFCFDYSSKFLVKDGKKVFN